MLLLLLLLLLLIMLLLLLMGMNIHLLPCLCEQFYLCPNAHGRSA